MKRKLTNLFWWAILIAAFVMGVYESVFKYDEPEINMSVMETQRFLVGEGYDIAIDGQLGNETEAAWNDYIDRKRGMK